MFRILSLTLALATPATAALAQVAPAPSAGATTEAAPAALLSDFARAELSATRPPSLRSAAEHALYTIGFALVGSGLGYFTSQVVYSDWDKLTNSTFASERRAYSLTGAAIGGALGFVLGLRSDGAAVGVDIPIYQELAGRDVIIGAELRRGTAANVYDAVQTLRPDWLVLRKPRGGAETAVARGSDRSVDIVVQAEPTIKVYRDGAYVGGTDALRDIPVSAVSSIRRLNSAEATTRFGAGHPHGALMLESADPGG